MLIPNHPHDERLSALASADPDALADSALSEHVSSCHRCTESVAELGALRASLAELPDLHPHRPLQLLPPVPDPEPSRADRLGGWARRFFAPALTAGAAIAMVGLVGTTAPLLGGMAGGQAAAPMELSEDAQTDGGQPAAGGADASEEPGTLAAPEDGGDAAVQPLTSQRELVAQETADTDNLRQALVDERSIWPMILFAGIALMIAAALLRWILAPRAG